MLTTVFGHTIPAIRYLELDFVGQLNLLIVVFFEMIFKKVDCMDNVFTGSLFDALS